MLFGCSATLTPTPTPRPVYSPQPGGAFPADLVDGLVTEVDLPFTQAVECGGRECRIPLDILAPPDGENLPTFVLVPGGPGEFALRRYMDALAAGIAKRGAVVFLSTYRSTATGDSRDESLIDVRCAIRYARDNAAHYGGDPERLVLVGHSFGSYLVIETGVNDEDETPSCSADADGVPDAVVGLSLFDLGLPVERHNGPPFRLAGGSNDPQSAGGAGMADRLQTAGFDAEYREFEGVDHPGMVDPATPGVLDLMFEAAELVGI